MEINTLGLTAALTAFFSIWFGHVAVRKIESISPTIWFPATTFVILGVTLEILSLSVIHLWSVVFGVFGLTLLFDALEFNRQQNRIKKGHAPANPNNPRHALILADSNFHATTLDLLKRNPIGEPVDPTQVVKLLSEH
jgi:uncharacterized protein DUF4491